MHSKAIVGDEAFFSDDFNEFYKFHGIKGLPCGPVRWQFDEKTRKSHIVVEQSLCELTEIVIQKGQKDDEKCDKDMHTAYRFHYLEAKSGYDQ